MGWIAWLALALGAAVVVALVVASARLDRPESEEDWKWRQW